MRRIDDSRRASNVRVQYQDAAAAASYAVAHEGWSPSARYFYSRLYAVMDSLRVARGGDLVDVGCGPGMLLRRLSEIRPGAFRITAVDQSPGMIQEAAKRMDGEHVRLAVGRAEDMPFADASFDVVTAMGMLEYAQADLALKEFARIARMGGYVLVTMLNPLSPYRLFEWGVYGSLLRGLGLVEGLLGRPAGRRHGAIRSGIRAIPAPMLRRMMRKRGLRPCDVVYYDLTPLVPPLDRFARRWMRRWREHPERTVSRGVGRWIGTAYLVLARREGASGGSAGGLATARSALSRQALAGDSDSVAEHQHGPARRRVHEGAWRDDDLHRQ